MLKQANVGFQIGELTRLMYTLSSKRKRMDEKIISKDRGFAIGLILGLIAGVLTGELVYGLLGGLLFGLGIRAFLGQRENG